jgi:hypothetical protein
MARSSTDPFVLDTKRRQRRQRWKVAAIAFVAGLLTFSVPILVQRFTARIVGVEVVAGETRVYWVRGGRVWSEVLDADRQPGPR